jgi:dipeptidyl aminopeptidase/acylaminoacyl peptidase
MPDGKEILFSANGALWRLAVTGESKPVRLPFVGEDGIMPAVSRAEPGRARLAYVRSFGDSNVWRVETSAIGAPASSPPVAVAAMSSTRGDSNAQLSPDGRRAAFASNRSGTMEIWVADADGASVFRLTSMGAPMTGTPRWSPDGQRIAFDSNIEGRFELYVIPSVGGKPRQLTSDPANHHVPSFSRDGKWVYFSSNRSGEDQIWKTPVDGGAPLQVTNNGGYVAFESPDRDFVYYTQTSTAPSALWRVPTAGGPPRKVLEGVIRRAFTVLEKGIYYIDRPSGETQLQFFDFATGKSTIVARNLGEIGFGLTASPDGRTILYSRLDSAVNDVMLVENFR